MPLATVSRFFNANTAGIVALQGAVLANDDKPDIGNRVFDARIINDGDKDVTVVLQGTSDGGTTWTTRATQTCKARGQSTITGSVRGTETNYRIKCTTSEGETSGRLEIFNNSNFYKV